MSAPLPWFRAYTEMIDDEKLRLLAFEDRWHFIALLCLKGQGVLDDAGPLLLRKVAVKMGIDTRTLEEVARRLAEVGLVERETLQPLNWNARQMRSDTDPTAAERKRRQRAKAKADAGSDGVTDKSRVTGHDVTRTDIDTDIDKDKEEVVKELADVGGGPATADPDPAPAALAKKPKPAPATATRLPDDWTLLKAWGDWALRERPDMTPEDVRREADCFADHWRAKAGANAKKLDWAATWRNWIRRSDGPKPAFRGNASGHSRSVNKQEELEARNRAVGQSWVEKMRGGRSMGGAANA
ncbi:hypothetical protein [Comamonas sp. JUb58]|uniref:hypothetical protein n=1 Tax=Comamonas sp. JUb58 TaxID=2485114 RepID=UPI0010613117|nr:hypothetical protein [Comamonas sp. JUb58]TDS74392.1 hypothetical protein EDF71_11772 [Comamonas sp. JUb58]